MASHAPPMSGKRVLGVRSEPAAIHWAIVSGTFAGPVLEASGRESVPITYSEGEGLAWIRGRVDYLIDAYTPTRIAIRYPERNARGANTDAARSRCRVEGVVLEVASSKNLDIVTGAMNTFARHSGTSPKEDLTNSDLRGLDWASYRDVKQREAILVAAALLPR